MSHQASTKTAFPLRLLLALNGIDAGVTLVLFALDGPSIEENWAMRFLLKCSPFLFLVVKVAAVDLLGTGLANSPIPLARKMLWVGVFVYWTLILRELVGLNLL